MENVLEKSIGEIVSEDYRTARVFEGHKIDFCCRGSRSVAEVCESKNLDPKKLIQELELVKQGKATGSNDFKNWPLDLLADYIEKVHHRYVDTNLPIIKQYLTKLCQVHGNAHPELLEINQEFIASAGELTAHMKKEEFILFPYVRKMAKSMVTKTSIEAPHFGSVQNPVKMMLEEHVTEGDRFARISKLSNNYTPPSDGCETYRVTYALLAEFEADLHLHIHLENNILFPKSIRMEEELTVVT